MSTSPLPSDSLFSYLQELSSKKILCIGDCMLDTFIHGNVDKLSPEAPVPVFRESRKSLMLGGVGNVARNIATFRPKVTLVSVVGEDVEGKRFRRLLKSYTNIYAQLFEDSARPTTSKTRYISGSQHLLRVDKEITHPISQQIQQQIIEYLKDVITQQDVIVISDYSKGFFTHKLLQDILEIAAAHKKVVIVDPKGNDYEKYNGATIVTPNRSELFHATGRIGGATPAADQ